MAEVRLVVESRTAFGNGPARRIRRSSRVPAVLYGHGVAPIHLSLPAHDTMLALKTPNVLLALRIDDRDELAIPREVQRHPIRGSIEHVDLLLVRHGEKVTVEVPVAVVGEAEPDTLVTVIAPVVSIEAEATHLPASVEVSVDGAAAGTQILAGAIPLPVGVTLHADPASLVVNVTAASTAADVEAELAAAEAEAGIVQQAPAERDDVAPDTTASTDG